MAVYTKLTFTDIAQHLKQFSLGELVGFKEIIEGIDNSNFILETKKDSKINKFILTIFESRINKDQLPFFINFKSHLTQHNISCPQPIANNIGDTINEIKGKKSVIVNFLCGKSLAPNIDGYYDNITSTHCFEVGKVLAQMHLAAHDFTMSRPNDLGVTGWKNLFAKFEHMLNPPSPETSSLSSLKPSGFEDLPQQERSSATTSLRMTNIKQEISTTLEFLQKSWQHDLPSAAAHLDLFPDNVFFAENSKLSGVIDFYFSANDLLIYDFAIIVNAWCFDANNDFDTNKYNAMLQGYESVRKFSNSEKDFLKIALIGAAMRFLLTRLHDMFFTPKNSLVKIKNPQEYLMKMKYFKDEVF